MRLQSRIFFSLLLGLGPIHLPQVATPQTLRPKLRVAHIGFELDGSWKFSKNVTLSPDGDLVAVADRRDDLLDRARRAYPNGVKLYRDYVTLLDEVKPDAVLSTTPNNEHLAILRECAQRRIPVWFQKPAASTAADAAEMLRLARQANIQVMISDHTQFTPAAQTIQARIREGLIGPVQRLHIYHRFFASKTLSIYYGTYFKDPLRHGGGAIMDQGTYGINWAVCLLGMPKSIYAVGHQFNPEHGHSQEDYGLVVLTYDNASVVIEAGWWARPDHGKGGRGELWAYGPKGSLWRDDVKVRFEPAVNNVSEASQPRDLELVQIAPHNQDGVFHFLYAIRTGTAVDTPHTLETHVMINAIVDKAYESIRTGRAVTLDAQR